MSHTLRSTLLSIALVVCLVAAAEPAAAQAKLLTVPDTTAKKGDTLLVPLRISSLATLDSVYSGQFTLSYNSGVMYIYDISTAGTLLAGTGNVSFNPTTRQLAFASGTIITGSGPLIYLKVATSASPSSLTDVISVTSAAFNEGTPAITIHNGNFRFRTITISPKTPPGNLVVGDSLQFSVSGDQIPPLTWTSSNPSFATIDANGKLHGVGVGQLTVYVQDSQGLRDSTNLFPINSPLLNSLTLSLHDTSYTQTLTFNLPVYISDVTSLGIISSQFTLTFNSSILQALDVIKAGSMSSTWTAPAYNISGGRIDVALAGSQPLSGSGVLVYVRFKVLPAASGSTTIALSNVLFNETIHASLVNGNFGTIAAPILIIAPATGILTKGDTTTFRVTSGGHPPYSWTSTSPSVATIGNTTGLLTAIARGTTTVAVVDSLSFAATSGSIAINDLRVSLPDTSVNIADSVDVPITTDLLTGLGIYSYDFRLVYDSTVVKIAQVLTAGTLSSGMTIAVRDTVDTLRVGAAGPAPLSGSGTLLKIRFKAAPGVSLSQLSSTRFAFFNFNEPGSGTATATPRNGSITIGNVLPSAPAAPTLLSPTTGATGVAVAPALSWNASTGATSYTLQVSTVANFASTVVNQSGIAATSFSASGLANNTLYYWRVSATNAGGTSAYSTGFSFTTIIAAPPPPSLVSPASASTGVSLTPTLSWNAASTATSYTVQVSTDPAFGSFVINQAGVASTSYVAGGLSGNTTYYWRVSGTNVGGAGNYSSVFNFATGSGAPAAPVLSSPHDTATAIALSPTLSWNAVTGATSYTLQVSTAADFSALVVNQSGIAGVSSSVGPLTATTLYYWRASATNAGGTSAFSSAFRFTTAIAPPAASTLVSPHDTATGIAVNPTLTWNSSATATSYTVQISTSPTFSSFVVNQNGIATNSYNATGLGGVTLYFWRVSATNAGGSSAFSSTLSFTTTLSPPAAPTLSTPQNGAVLVSVSPTLSWNASVGATSYTLQVSTAADFSALIVNQSGITGTSAPVSGLSNSTVYYWRVSASNVGGSSSYSSAFSFTTIIAPPAAPSLLSPHDTATGVAISPSFTWNTSPTATSYTIQVSTSPSFASFVVNVSGITPTSYNAFGLGGNGTFYWRVSATNAGGTSSFSAPFSFSTLLTAPSAPTLVSPANIATGISTNPTLSWNASPAATSYFLEVSTAADFSVLIVFQPSIAATSYNASGLLPNTQYYWRVSAANTAGGGSFSSAFSFTTGIALAAPTLISPANGATGVLRFSAILIWHPSAGATSYKVQVSLTSDMSLLVVDQSNITDTSFTLGQLAPGTQYYWAVKPVNAGGEGVSSAVYSFTTIVSLPQAPALISPSNGATSVSPTNPTLIWHSSAGATSYTLLVSTTANMSALIVNQSNITDTSFTLGVLSLGAQFYWAVRPANASGQGPISAVYSFTVITPPQAPTLISPANGATSVSPNNPTWVWHSAAGATSYTLAVSTNANMTDLILIHPNISDTSFTLAGSLNYGTQYYWGVRPANASGEGVFSAVFSFTTIVIRPQAPPTLISPANGAISVSPNNPTLVWHSVAGATSYTLLVSTTADMSALILNRPNITDTSSTLGVLNSGTHYYWAVRPANAGGEGVFSTVFSFTTAGAATLVEYMKSSIADKYLLDQNYPNPFNPSTMIPYSLPHRSVVRVSVYSLLGTEVAVLVNGERSAGSYEVRLDAAAFPSGVYLIKMQASPLEGGTGQPFVATRKVVLLK